MYIYSSREFQIQSIQINNKGLYEEYDFIKLEEFISSDYPKKIKK
jgi:hypothetical protein